jgi:ketol-acid reductoisomerase
MLRARSGPRRPRKVPPDTEEAADLAIPHHPSPGTVLSLDDADLEPLAGRTVAVLGYGTMGRAHAHNVKRAGVDVLVGARTGSARGALAREEGFRVVTIAQATAEAQVVALMLPDEAMAGVYRQDIAPHLNAGAALVFAHGFAIAFAQIEPEPDRPCVLVAPKGQGDALREAVAAGGGLPGLIAVTAASPAGTWELAAAYALAVGCLHGGAVVTTFREECVADQFGEQTVLCGGVVELLQAAFTTLVERGYGADNAYFECVHELMIITDLMQRHGVDGMRRRISGTAAYGGLTRGPRVIDAAVRRRLHDILDEIESGAFATEYLARHDHPEHGLDALVAREAASPLARTGRRLAMRLRALESDGANRVPPRGPRPEAEEEQS